MSTIDELPRRAIASTDARSAWLRAHLAFALVLVVWALAYGETIVSLVSIWANTGTFQYAFLIFPISVVLIWLRRPALPAVAPTFSVWGVAGLAAISLVWLVGALVSASILQHFSVVAAVPLAVLACYGLAVARVLFFPLVYMFFAVPFGAVLVVPLQNITAHFSVKALQLSGATVFQEGHLIYMPVATFEVAEACSGVRFFIATTALGTLYAYLFYRSWLRRILFVAAAIVAPVIANGLRVYFTVMIGQHLGMEYATGTDHLIFGWQFFGTVLVLLFLAGWYWHEAPTEISPDVRAALPSDRQSGSRRVVAAVVAALVLAAGPGIWAWTATAPYVPGAVAHLAPQRAVTDGWKLVAGDSNPLGSAFNHADAYLSAVYQGGSGALVTVYAAVYRGQPQGRHDLLTFGNVAYDAHTWNWLASATRSIGGITVNEVRLQNSGGSRLLWYWYVIDGHATTNRAWAKLLQAWSRLRGASTKSSVMVISTALMPGKLDGARAILNGFLEGNRSSIEELLGMTVHAVDPP